MKLSGPEFFPIYFPRVVLSYWGIGLVFSLLCYGCVYPESSANDLFDNGIDGDISVLQVSDLPSSDEVQFVDVNSLESSESEVDDSQQDKGTTYHRSVRPIIEKSCRGCHSQEGFAPFPFEEYAEVKASASLILDAITSGRMPPWMPEPGCHPLTGIRSLAQEEIAVISLWIEEGALEGDPAEYIPPEVLPTVELNEANIEIEPVEGYIPDSAGPDDLRCLPLPYNFESDTYLSATEILPGRKDWVHHAVIYRIEGDDFGSVEALDQASPSVPGYPCFGGPGIQNYDLLGGWVPGAGPMVAPEGSAMKVEAGSRLILEIHYSGPVAVGTSGAEADLTRVQLWTYPQGSVPENLMLFTEFMHLDLDIKAHDPGSVQEAIFTVDFASTLVAVAPHMHLLGSGFVFEHLPSGGQDACLLDITEWDFWWQQFFHYPKEAYVFLKEGDKVRLRCTYDNTVANQPVVNGVQRDPRDVRWGESSLDEMCIANMILLVPNPDFSGSK